MIKRKRTDAPMVHIGNIVDAKSQLQIAELIRLILSTSSGDAVKIAALAEIGRVFSVSATTITNSNFTNN